MQRQRPSTATMEGPGIDFIGRGRTVAIVTTVATTHEAFLLPHAERLGSMGFRVVGVANGLSRSPSAVQTYDAVYDIKLGRRPAIPDIVATFRALQHVVEVEKLSAVWVHTPLASAIGRAAFARHRRFGLRVAYMAHGFHFGSVSQTLSSRVYRGIEWSLSRFTDHLQTVNNEDYVRALGFPGRNHDNTELTVGVGIDPTRFEEARSERERSRRLLGLAPTDRAVFVIGDLNPEKRVGDALRAVATLDPNVAMFVIGKGPMRRPLEDLADRLPGRRAQFLGYRRDVATLLAGGDLLVHPSSREGLPTVVLEAQALGIPVVGAHIRGTADLLADGAGLTYPVGNHRALAQAISWILDDEELRASVIERGQRRVRDHSVDLATQAADKIGHLAATSPVTPSAR